MLREHSVGQAVGFASRFDSGREGVHDIPVTSISPVRAWMLRGLSEQAGQLPGPHGEAPVERTRPWWQVMCLTGVDYFSTLGYQPGIAFIAAGAVSPLATIVLVVLTLVGALPVYRRVAKESFRGEGSIAMLERLLPWWGGKLFVLVLLGFVATDFTITITLSAADASAHAIANPLVQQGLGGALNGQQMLVTLFLVILLGAVFLRGFREAINIAVVLVTVYLSLNAVVVVVALVHLLQHPVLVSDWLGVLAKNPGNPTGVVILALLVFPKLALGMSGFETGVVVMPQIRGVEGDTDANPAGRIRGTRRLLLTAAVIMSVMLIASSFLTTLLIPAKELGENGSANARALAYLAHEYLGSVFGTCYDVSTILILWFAGASAMAGLLNLVPRYLPRYGMAPAWAKLVRPLVIVFTVISIVVTLVFNASVDAQGGAYATGVLVLILSATVAVALSAIRHKQRAATIGFIAVAVAFVYTLIANVIERPDGVRIAALFILGIILVSIVSRIQRSFQLRARTITLDQTVLDWIREDADDRDEIIVISHEPDKGRAEDYAAKISEERRYAGLNSRAPVLFLEVYPADSSDFEEDLEVRGEVVHGNRVMRVSSANVPNTIAAVLLRIRDETGVKPDAYFDWSEGSPVQNMLKFLVTGVGEVAPVTREVLRRSEHDPARRPDVHVS